MKKKKTANSISLDGVSFSKSFIASHKSESEFISAMNEKSYSHVFPGENRDAKLREVYSLAVPKSEVAEVKQSPSKGKQ